MNAPIARNTDSVHRWRASAATPRLTLFGIALAAAVGGAFVAYVLNDEQPEPMVVAASPDQPPQAAVASLPPVAATAPAATSGVPKPAWLKAPTEQTPGMTLAELEELQQTLTSSSAPADEQFTRLQEQVLLTDATQRFLQLRGSPNPDREELQGLARLIDPVLDAQLQRGELSRADALELKWQLLQVLYPQVDRQQAELTRWLAAHPAR